MWLGLTTLPRKDRDDLLGAPITSEGLFESILFFTQHFKWLEEEKSQLRRMVKVQISERVPVSRAPDKRRPTAQQK